MLTRRAFRAAVAAMATLATPGATMRVCWAHGLSGVPVDVLQTNQIRRRSDQIRVGHIRGAPPSTLSTLGGTTHYPGTERVGGRVPLCPHHRDS